jgi:hypothetical protein
MNVSIERAFENPAAKTEKCKRLRSQFLNGEMSQGKLFMSGTLIGIERGGEEQGRWGPPSMTCLSLFAWCVRNRREADGNAASPKQANPGRTIAGSLETTHCRVEIKAKRPRSCLPSRQRRGCHASPIA